MGCHQPSKTEYARRDENLTSERRLLLFSVRLLVVARIHFWGESGPGAYDTLHGIRVRGSPGTSKMALSKGFTTRRSLLEAIRDTSNDEAWREFLGMYQPMIVSWCLGLGLGIDDAEEVGAEIVGKLVVVMRGFVQDPRYRFRGWLKTVVKHAVIDFLRRRGREPRTLPLDDPVVQWHLENCKVPPGIEQVAEALEEAVAEGLRISERVRQQVNPDAWQAFWRTAVAGEPAREVAAELGMTIAAVYTSKSRVAKLLRAEGATVDTGRDCRQPDGAHA
jgi:RNA polymerase sigma factor (sigma-70 family)